MNRKVDAPTMIVAMIGLVALLYGIYWFNHRPSPIPGAGQIPPPLPGQDKPLPPPPGMHVPGKITR
jgi:hypothetical protein